MQFLAPFWLALGAAAAVPLLLHLWNRRRAGERVLFPAVRLLAAATEARGAAIRLRDWILLALRVLAVILIAVAAAQPDVRGRVGTRAPRAVALVLDNSLSTSAVVGGRSVLDALRAELRSALGSLTPGDRVWLLTADGAVLAGDVATIRAALDAVHPLNGAGNMPGALRRGAALVIGAERARREAGATPGAVILATDAQATTWAHPVTLGDVRVAIIRARGDAPADRGVAALSADPVRWSSDGVVTGRLTGAGDWHLALRDSAGRLASDARGSATAADSFAVRVPLRPAARGWLAGTLDVPPDELRGDDVRHLAVFVGAPPQLAADPSAGPFATVGVATLVEGRALSAPADAPVTASTIAPRITEPLATTRRPAVLVAPSDASHLPVVNRALDRLGVPWRFAALVDVPSTATFRTGATVPVLRRWRLAYAGRAATAPTDTLASAGGDPWAVAGQGYVLLASPLDTAWTPFPTRAAFLPWLATAAARLADPPGVVTRPTSAAPGALVRAPDGVDALLSAAGPPRPLHGADVTAPDTPGVYFWLRAGARVGALVVDPEGEEVVLARLDAKGIGGRVRVGAGGAVDVGTGGADAAAFALGAGGRRSLAALLAAAAVLLLGGEALAARPRASV